MVLFYNNLPINANQTITLVALPNYVNTIACASVYSRPDITLTLYDTQSLLPLSTSLNSNNTKSCLQSNVCTNILYVYFQFQNNQFNSLNSISCSANSTNPNVPLLSVITRNATISSKYKFERMSVSFTEQSYLRALYVLKYPKFFTKIKAHSSKDFYF